MTAVVTHRRIRRLITRQPSGRWWCASCMGSFGNEGVLAPRECPAGHPASLIEERTEVVRPEEEASSETPHRSGTVRQQRSRRSEGTESMPGAKTARQARAPRKRSGKGADYKFTDFPVGSVLTKTYHGVQYEAVVEEAKGEDGTPGAVTRFTVAPKPLIGQVFRSPSAAARAITEHYAVTGYKFWKLLGANGTADAAEREGAAEGEGEVKPKRTRAPRKPSPLSEGRTPRAKKAAAGAQA